MPLQRIERGQLFFGNEKTGFHLLGEFQEVELDINCDKSEDIPFLDIGSSFEFTAEIKPPDRMTVGDVLLAFCGIDVHNLRQNNWRKMHGMVMHRRMKTRGKGKA